MVKAPSGACNLCVKIIANASTLTSKTMKTWISILAGVALAAAAPVNAAAPDYVAFNRKIDAISTFLMSGELCTRIGDTWRGLQSMRDCGLCTKQEHDQRGALI